jgi:predicted dehydrogenase
MRRPNVNSEGGAGHRAILDDPNVEAIFVCSSTDTHSQMIIEALRPENISFVKNH